MNKNNILWVFIDDSKTDDKKYFLTMFIVTEYSNFDYEIQIMKSRLSKINKNVEINKFLNIPKHYTYKGLSDKNKNIVNSVLSDVKNKILEHSFLSRKIIKQKDCDYYYKDHIKQITSYVLEKYRHTYKTIVFDHSSNPKINELVAYENKNLKIIPGNDQKETGLIVVDLLRSKITF